jgi:predicted nucleic acid-binding protein
VITNPRRVHNPRSTEEALDTIEQFIALPGITMIPIPIDVVSRWTAHARVHKVRGSDIFDLQIVATMLANGVRKIFTFDRTHFEFIPELEVITPH